LDTGVQALYQDLTPSLTNEVGDSSSDKTLTVNGAASSLGTESPRANSDAGFNSGIQLKKNK